MFCGPENIDLFGIAIAGDIPVEIGLESLSDKDGVPEMKRYVIEYIIHQKFRTHKFRTNAGKSTYLE